MAELPTPYEYPKHLYDHVRPERFDAPSRGHMGFFENFVESVATDTWLGQTFRRGKFLVEEREKLDPYVPPAADWNPILDGDLKGYEPWVQRFAGARSPAEIEMIKRTIEANDIGKRELEHGGAGMSRFAAGIVDPLNFVPLPGLAGIGFVRGALKGAGGFGVVAAGSEALRYELDPTATAQEGIANVGMGALFGLALGAPLGRFGRLRADLGGPPQNAPTRTGPLGASTPFADVRPSSKIEALAEVYDRLQRAEDPPRSPLNAAEVAQAQQLPFAKMKGEDVVLTEKWQQVPPGAVLPAGAHVRMDPNGGVAVARMPAQGPGGSAFTKAERDRLGRMKPEERDAFQEALYAEMEKRAAVDVHHREAIGRAIEERQALVGIKRAIAEYEEKSKTAANESWRTKNANMAAQLREELPAAEGTARIAANDAERAVKAHAEANGNPDDYFLLQAPGINMFARSGQMPFYATVNNGWLMTAPKLSRWISSIGHRMAGSPGLLTRGAERGVAPPASVEHAAKQWWAVHNEVDDFVKNQYLKYLGYEITGRLAWAKETIQQNIIDPVKRRLGADGRLGDRMSQNEFLEAVGRAIISKGESENPHIKLAAEKINEFNKKVLKEMLDLGIFRTQESMKKRIDYLDQQLDFHDRRIESMAEYESKIGEALTDAAAGKFEKIDEIYRGSRLRAALNELAGEAPAPGFTRLWRVDAVDEKLGGVPDWVKESPEHKAMLNAAGRWFADDVGETAWYWNFAVKNGAEPKLSFIDMRREDAAKFKVSKAPDNVKAFSRRPDSEFFVDREAADKRVDVGVSRETAPKHLLDLLEKPGAIDSRRAVGWAEERLVTLEESRFRLEQENATKLMEREDVKQQMDAYQALGGDDKPEWYFHTLWNRDVVAKKRDVLEARLVEHYRQNPHTIINGKIIELSTNEGALLSRAKETVDTILRHAEFQNGMGNIDVRPPGEAWKDTAARITKEGEKLQAEGRTEQAKIAFRRAEYILNHGREGKLGGSFGQSSPLLGRKLDMPRALLMDAGDNEAFIVTRSDLVQEHYVQRTASAIEMARAFNDSPRLDKTFDRLRGEMDAERARLIDADDVAGYQKAVEETKRSEKAFLDLRDKVLGNFGIAENPSAMSLRATRFVLGYNALSAMGKAWMSAITDAAKITFTEGLGRTLGHAFDAFSQGLSRDPDIRRWIKAGGKEVRDAGQAWEVARSTRAAQLSEQGEHFSQTTKLERGMATATKWLFNINLLNPWTDMMKKFGGGLAQSRMIEDSIKLANGEKLSKINKQLLVSAGIDENIARIFKREWEAAGGEVHEGQGGQYFLANTAKWSDREAVRTFQSILSQQTDTIVITPGAADRPNFMSHPVAKLMLQYRTFSMSATQRIMMAAMQRDDKMRLSGIAALVGTGVILDMLKAPDTAPSFLDADKSWKQDIGARLYRGVEMSGVLGIFADMNNALEVASGNQIGMRPQLGLAPMLKDPSWAQRVGSVTGPSSTMLMQLLWAFTSNDADGSDKARAIRYATPLNNWWAWSDFFARAQKGLAGGLE